MDFPKCIDHLELNWHDSLLNNKSEIPQTDFLIKVKFRLHHDIVHTAAFKTDGHLSIFSDAQREAELGMAAVQSEFSSCVKVEVAVLGSSP